LSRVSTYLKDLLAATRDLWGVLAPLLLLFIPDGYAQALYLFLWDLRYLTPIRAYNKFWYLAVCSGSALILLDRYPGHVRGPF